MTGSSPTATLPPRMMWHTLSSPTEMYHPHYSKASSLTSSALLVSTAALDSPARHCRSSSKAKEHCSNTTSVLHCQFLKSLFGYLTAVIRLSRVELVVVRHLIQCIRARTVRASWSEQARGLVSPRYLERAS